MPILIIFIQRSRFAYDGVHQGVSLGQEFRIGSNVCAELHKFTEMLLDGRSNGGTVEFAMEEHHGQAGCAPCCRRPKMRKALRWRYYCDHCAKVGGSAYHMARHEAGCTANPRRTCGFCGSTRPVAELVAVLEGPAPDWRAGMAALRMAVQECPACMLAAIRQVRAHHSGSEDSWDTPIGDYRLFGYDYAHERAAWWRAHPRPQRPSGGPTLSQLMALVTGQTPSSIPRSPDDH